MNTKEKNFPPEFYNPNLTEEDVDKTMLQMESNDKKEFSSFSNFLDWAQQEGSLSENQIDKLNKDFLEGNLNINRTNELLNKLSKEDIIRLIKAIKLSLKDKIDFTYNNFKHLFKTKEAFLIGLELSSSLTMIGTLNYLRYKNFTINPFYVENIYANETYNFTTLEKTQKSIIAYFNDPSMNSVQFRRFFEPIRKIKPELYQKLLSLAFDKEKGVSLEEIINEIDSLSEYWNAEETIEYNNKTVIDSQKFFNLLISYSQNTFQEVYDIYVNLPKQKKKSLNQFLEQYFSEQIKEYGNINHIESYLVEDLYYSSIQNNSDYKSLYLNFLIKFKLFTSSSSAELKYFNEEKDIVISKLFNQMTSPILKINEPNKYHSMEFTLPTNTSREYQIELTKFFNFNIYLPASYSDLTINGEKVSKADVAFIPRINLYEKDSYSQRKQEKHLRFFLEIKFNECTLKKYKGQIVTYSVIIRKPEHTGYTPKTLNFKIKF